MKFFNFSLIITALLLVTSCGQAVPPSDSGTNPKTTSPAPPAGSGNGSGTPPISGGGSPTVNPSAKIIFASSPQKVTSGVCSGSPVVIRNTPASPSDNSSLPASADLAFILKSNNIKFFNESTCSSQNQINSVVIRAGLSSTYFYFKSTVSGNNYLSVDGPQGYTEIYQNESITASVPDSLAIQPFSTNGVINQPLSIEPKVYITDKYGNTEPAPPQSDTITASPFLDNLCTQPASGVLSSNIVGLSADGSATFTNLTYSFPETIYLQFVDYSTSISKCSSAITFTSN